MVFALVFVETLSSEVAFQGVCLKVGAVTTREAISKVKFDPVKRIVCLYFWLDQLVCGHEMNDLPLSVLPFRCYFIWFIFWSILDHLFLEKLISK